MNFATRKLRRIKILATVATKKIMLAFLSFFPSKRFTIPTSGYVFALERSGGLNSHSGLNWLEIERRWRQTDIKWTAGLYKEVVIERKRILNEIYLRSEVLTQGYFPPILSFGFVGAIGHNAILGIHLKAQELGLLPRGTRTISVEPHDFSTRPMLGAVREKLNLVQSKDAAAWTELPSMWQAVERIQMFRGNDDFKDLYEIKEKVFAEGEISATNPIISLEGKYTERADAYLKARGLPSGAWFVSLHIRNEGAGDARRNQPVQSFTEAIKYIIEQGGWVIRIGDATMEPLDKMKNLIDLAIDKESRFVHPHVMQQARFHIGTCSGPTWAAAVLGTPVLMTNATSIGRNAHSMSAGSLFLPKRIIKESRQLTLSEILIHTEGYSEMEVRDLLKSKIQLLPNTSDEIKASVQEMFSFVNNPVTSTSDVDLTVNKIRKEHGAIGFGKFSNSFVINNPKWLI